VAQGARLGQPADVDALAAVARSLAAHGLDGLGEALAVLGAAVSGRAAVRRVPRQRSTRRGGVLLDVPLRIAGSAYGVLEVRTRMPLDASGAALVTAAADIVCLAFAASESAGEQEMLDAEADLAAVASLLRDTVGQALVAARYAADLAVLGRLPVEAVPEALQAALRALGGVLGDLRSRAVDGRLGAALRELSGVRSAADDGEGSDAVQVVVRAEDPALDELPASVGMLALRVVLAALARPPATVRVNARVIDDRLKLDVTCAENPYDAPTLERWARRASALGGLLECHDHGVSLTVPVGDAEGGP
jgi:hypothetical protein